MLLIATGLQSRALAVLSCVRDSEVFVSFQICLPDMALGFVIALSCCWDMDLAMGQWKLTHFGLPAADLGLACVLKGAWCRPPTASGGGHFSLVQTLTLASSPGSRS